MNHPQLLELPVRCRIVRARRLTPFHWALLRALQHFPAGTRPTLPDFAARLGLVGPSIPQERSPASSIDASIPSTQPEAQPASAGTRFPGLYAAWEELLDRHAIDNPDFQEALLTLEGLDALRLDYFPQAPAEEQQRFLHFDLSGHPRPYSPPLPAKSQPHAALPAKALPLDALPAKALPLDALPAKALPLAALPVKSHPLAALPAWQSALTPELLATHLRSPACSSPLFDTEELQSAHPLWPEARLL